MLGPGLAGELLHTHAQLARGVAIAALSVSGSGAQLVGRNLSDRTLTAGGAVVLAFGLGCTATAVAAGSAIFYLTATAVTGNGFGLAFMGGLRHLSSAIPQHRSFVMSAFCVVAYLSISLPAIAAGLAEPTLGLAQTFEIFSAGAVLVALVVTAGGLRIPQAGADLLQAPTVGR